MGKEVDQVKANLALHAPSSQPASNYGGAIPKGTAASKNRAGRTSGESMTSNYKGAERRSTDSSGVGHSNTTENYTSNDFAGPRNTDSITSSNDSGAGAIRPANLPPIWTLEPGHVWRPRIPNQLKTGRTKGTPKWEFDNRETIRKKVCEFNHRMGMLKNKVSETLQLKSIGC